MNMKNLESELLKLSPKERAELVYKILQSLESEAMDDIEEVWVNEALERYKQISMDENIGIDLEKVVKEAKSKYK